MWRRRSLASFANVEISIQLFSGAGFSGTTGFAPGGAFLESSHVLDNFLMFLSPSSSDVLISFIASFAHTFAHTFPDTFADIISFALIVQLYSDVNY